MCGRVAQKRDPNYYGSILKVDWTKGIPNAPAHYNGAPGQEYWWHAFTPNRRYDPRHDPLGPASVLGQGPQDGLEDD
jgi:hypothetical protein